MPAGHSSGLCTAHMRHGSNDYVAQAQGLAYQHDLKLDRGANRQLPGAEKKDAGGADVASDEGYRRFFENSASTAKAQREIQSGAGIFPMFWVHAHGMSWHADKAPRLGRAQERRQAKGRNARRIRERLRSPYSFASFRGWFGWPRFKWRYALRRAHLALRDSTTLSLAKAQQTELPN
jgi:hypothetical protein